MSCKFLVVSFPFIVLDIQWDSPDELMAFSSGNFFLVSFSSLSVLYRFHINTTVKHPFLSFHLSEVFVNFLT